MARRNRLVVLGGTFDHLHAGHHRMLSRAFRVGEEVGIGLSTDAFVRARRKPVPGVLQSYRERRRALREYLAVQYPHRRWYIVALSDPWGRSVQPAVEAIVLSEETAGAGAAIDAERRRRGLRPLRRYIVRMLHGPDGRAIRSRRIRSGEIDAHGRPRPTARRHGKA